MNMSDFGLSLSVTEAIQSVFQNHKEVSEVVLYGSRAKGNYKKGSDIDLSITKGLVDASLLFRLEDELDELMLPYKIDLSVYEQIDNERLKEHIDRIGILFYESETK